jgi:hypothetical protein
MYTGNVWGITLLIVGFLTTLVSCQLLVQAVFPGWTNRSAAALRTRTLASVLVGTGVLIVTTVLSLIAFNVFGNFGGVGKFLNALIVAGLTFPVVMGLAAVSRFVGERMPSPADAGRPWRATLRGGITCALAFVLPVVGWFFLLPAALATGFGAVTLGLFERPRAAGERAPHAAPVAAEIVA